MNSPRHRGKSKPRAILQDIPAQPRPLPSMTQRPQPLELNLVPDPFQLRLTMSQAEVFVEPPQHHAQVLLLVEALRMKVVAQPDFHPHQESTAASHGRDPDYRESSLSVPTADVSEPEKVEPPRAFPLMRGPLVRKTTEDHELRLPVRDREMELPQPLLQRGAEALRIPSVLEAGHVIVGETDQAGLALTLMREDPLEPQVEHVVKVDVGQDRRNWPPLEHPLLRPHDHAIDHGSCPQPFLDQSQDHRVADPKPEHLHQPRMVEMVEEPVDVGFDDVIYAAFEDVLAQLPQSLVRITPGPISVGHIQEVRFVDRFENPRHGSLQQPVLRRGHGRGKLRD